ARKQRGPLAPQLRAARANAGREVLRYLIRNQELRVLGPAVSALCKTHLVVSERLAVGRRGIVLMRRAVADVAVKDNKGRPPFGGSESVDRVLDQVEVVRIADAQHIPSVPQETRRDVFGKRELCLAFDRDVVVVVNPAQIVQAKMARQ